MREIDYGKEVQRVCAMHDLLQQALALCGLVTRLFAQRGSRLVVVGGAAIEFYTEGAYMSGDVDLCRTSAAPIPLREQQELMGLLNATGGPRSWKVGPLFVDLLGALENESIAPLRGMETPYGPIEIIPPELLIVERVLAATYPRPDEEAALCAKKLLSVAMADAVPVDWDEIRRLAMLPSFGVAQDVDLFKAEVRRAIG